LAAESGQQLFDDIDRIVSARNIDNYIDQVRRAEHARHIYHACVNAGRYAKCGEVEKAIGELQGIDEPESGMTKADYAREIIESHSKTAKGESLGAALPYRGMMHIPFGLVTMLAGRGGKGKSYLANTWIAHWTRTGIPVLHIALEDGTGRAMARLAACQGKYNLHDLDIGQASPAQRERERERLGEVVTAPVYYHDRHCSGKEIESIVASHVRRYGVRVVLVDGFKDILPPYGVDGTIEAQEANMTSLTRAARTHNVAVLSIAHLVKIDEDVLITESRIRGSGNIGNSARCIMALQDSGFKSECGGHVRLDTIKINHGLPGRVHLQKRLETAEFRELDTREEDGF